MYNSDQGSRYHPSFKGVLSSVDLFAAAPPPWFQAAVQQLRTDIRDDFRDTMRSTILRCLNRLRNQGMGGGAVVPFDIIPFTNGEDPTQPPHNLPLLSSVVVIDNLNGQQLVQYLTGYGNIPLPAGANPHATNHLRKDTLKRVIGAL